MHLSPVRFGIWSDPQRQTLAGVKAGGIDDIAALLRDNLETLVDPRGTDERKRLEERLARQIDSLRATSQIEQVVELLGNPGLTTGTYVKHTGWSGRHRFDPVYENVTGQYQPSGAVLEAIARAYRRTAKSNL